LRCCGENDEYMDDALEKYKQGDSMRNYEI